MVGVDPLIQVLLTLVVGLGGAYLGAKWGAEQGLKKFKSERAFDHRLEWYRDSVRALVRWGEAIHDLHVTTVQDHPDREAAWERHDLAHHDALARLVEAPLYATPEAQRMLREVELAERSFDVATGQLGEFLKLMDELGRYVKQAARALAYDGRTQVGLEALEVPAEARPEKGPALKAATLDYPEV